MSSLLRTVGILRAELEFASATPTPADLEQLADRHVEYLQNEIAPVARALYAFWLQQRSACTLPEGASVH